MYVESLGSIPKDLYHPGSVSALVECTLVDREKQNIEQGVRGERKAGVKTPAQGQEGRVGKESASTSCQDLCQQEDERVHATDNTNAMPSH